MAKKSIVLLKNQNDCHLKKIRPNILVIGALANDKTSPLGNWRLAADEVQLYH
jgi:beta-glucosidase